MLVSSRCKVSNQIHDDKYDSLKRESGIISVSAKRRLFGKVNETRKNSRTNHGRNMRKVMYELRRDINMNTFRKL